MTKPVWRNPPNRGGTSYDWQQVRALLRSQPTKWLLLNDEPEKESVAAAIRNGGIRAMAGVKVRTRDSFIDGAGIRRCDIYLKEGS